MSHQTHFGIFSLPTREAVEQLLRISALPPASVKEIFEEVKKDKLGATKHDAATKSPQVTQDRLAKDPRPSPEGSSVNKDQDQLPWTIPQVTEDKSVTALETDMDTNPELAEAAAIMKEMDNAHRHNVAAGMLDIANRTLGHTLTNETPIARFMDKYATKRPQVTQNKPAEDTSLPTKESLIVRKSTQEELGLLHQVNRPRASAAFTRMNYPGLTHR